MRTVKVDNYTLKRKKGMPHSYTVYYQKNNEEQWLYGFCYTAIDEITDYAKVFKILKGIE